MKTKKSYLTISPFIQLQNNQNKQTNNVILKTKQKKNNTMKLKIHHNTD